MATFVTSPQRIKLDTAVVSLTTVESALWKLGIPVLDARAVLEYKKSAKWRMLWAVIRWQLLGTAALVAFECLGRQWGRVALIGAAAVALTTLFAWLVYASDLQWLATGYTAYRALHAIPPHVSAAADSLVRCGVCEQHIGVEFLKADPILFVEDAEKRRRYDLIIW